MYQVNAFFYYYCQVDAVCSLFDYSALPVRIGFMRDVSEM